MISRKQMADSLAKLGMLRFFPTRPEVLAEVGKLLNELCESDAAAQRLTAAALEASGEWPGPLGLRDIVKSFEPVKYWDGSYLKANQDAAKP